MKDRKGEENGNREKARGLEPENLSGTDGTENTPEKDGQRS